MLRSVNVSNASPCHDPASIPGVACRLNDQEKHRGARDEKMSDATAICTKTCLLLKHVIDPNSSTFEGVAPQALWQPQLAENQTKKLRSGLQFTKPAVWALGSCPKITS